MSLTDQNLSATFSSAGSLPSLSLGSSLEKWASNHLKTKQGEVCKNTVHGPLNRHLMRGGPLLHQGIVGEIETHRGSHGQS